MIECDYPARFFSPSVPAAVRGGKIFNIESRNVEFRGKGGKGAGGGPDSGDAKSDLWLKWISRK